MMEEYLDEILREAAGRYNRGKPPLSFRQLKERWRDFTEKAGGRYRQAGSTSGGEKPNNPGQQGGNGSGNKQKGNQGSSNQTSQSGQANRNKNPKPRSGFQHRSGALRHQGKLICYLYNNKGPGCQRPAVSGGCDDGKGGSFAHVCNYETSPGQVCAAAHPRSKNH